MIGTRCESALNALLISGLSRSSVNVCRCFVTNFMLNQGRERYGVINEAMTILR
jgi:hypothetical protein